MLTAYVLGVLADCVFGVLWGGGVDVLAAVESFPVITCPNWLHVSMCS